MICILTQWRTRQVAVSRCSEEMMESSLVASRLTCSHRTEHVQCVSHRTSEVKHRNLRGRCRVTGTVKALVTYTFPTSTTSISQFSFTAIHCCFSFSTDQELSQA
ncbi:hypothetical protein SRHO_G00148110 [Serrasalmus rhombeus]